jgi:hypothetical protein
VRGTLVNVYFALVFCRARGKRGKTGNIGEYSKNVKIQLKKNAKRARTTREEEEKK